MRAVQVALERIEQEAERNSAAVLASSCLINAAELFVLTMPSDCRPSVVVSVCHGKVDLWIQCNDRRTYNSVFAVAVVDILSKDDNGFSHGIIIAKDGQQFKLVVVNEALAETP